MNLLSMSFFPIFGIMAFVAVVLLFEGLYMMWNSYKGPDAKKIEQRLRALSAGSDMSQQASVLKTRMGERGPYAITDDVVGSKDKSPRSFCDSKCSCILDTRRLLPVLF